MSIQWGMKLRGLFGSRWDVFNQHFKKLLSWTQFKELSSLYNTHLSRKSGWTFSKDQSYTMPAVNVHQENIRQIIEGPTNQTDSFKGLPQIDQIDSHEVQKGVVNASYLRFREKPGGELIQYLHHGKIVEIIETFSKWLHVRVDAQEGFVFRKYIVLENDIDRESQPEEISEKLSDFHGDLDWIHQREGHYGKPYWPGGSSGITIDPGVDLGYCDFSSIQKFYQDIFNPVQMQEVKKIADLKLKKKAANDYLRNEASETFRNIRITKSQAANVFPFVAGPYWEKIVNRFNHLRGPDVPDVVQTVMLSIAYNRGPGNGDLEILGKIIQNKEWKSLAYTIRNMQQNHKLHGIRKRRRAEAHYILLNV